MSAYPTMDDLNVRSDRAWDALNTNARYCAGLVREGLGEYAMREAQQVEARRVWWHEVMQQKEDLRRARLSDEASS